MHLRLEIVEDFDREVDGRVPAETQQVTWEMIASAAETKGAFRTVTRQFTGHGDNASYPQIRVEIKQAFATPVNDTGPVPVVMEFGFLGPSRFPVKPAPIGPSWQEPELEKGWGYAVLSPLSIQADNGQGLTEGIIGLVNKGQPRKLDDWGESGGNGFRLATRGGVYQLLRRGWREAPPAELGRVGGERRRA